MGTAEITLLALASYALVGVVVGGCFVISGIGKVDHAAIGAPWSFRLLIWPGAAALWPLMLLKWVHAARSAHDGEQQK